MFDNLAYPEIVLKKVVEYDPAVWNKLKTHADALFVEQKKDFVIDIKPQDAAVPNPFTMIRNAFARARNALLETKEHNSYFVFPSMTLTTEGMSYSYNSALRAPSMSRNLVAALVFYIERDPEAAEAAGITAQERHDLRHYAAPEKRGSAPRTPTHA